MTRIQCFKGQSACDLTRQHVFGRYSTRITQRVQTSAEAAQSLYLLLKKVFVFFVTISIHLT